MNNWLLYCLAVGLVVFSPGPMTLFALTNSLSYGKSFAVRGILGGSLAYCGHLLLAYFAMRHLVDLAPEALKLVRLLGAAYFFWLAYKQFRKDRFAGATGSGEAAERPRPRVEIQGFMIAATNPKAIIFFVALFPQFIDTTRNYSSQFVLLGLTYLVIQFASNFSYSWFGSHLMSKVSASKADKVIPKVLCLLLGIIGLLMLISVKPGT